MKDTTKTKVPAPVCYHRNRLGENRRTINIHTTIIRCGEKICKFFALCAAWMAFAALCALIEGAGMPALMGLVVGVLSALGWINAGFELENEKGEKNDLHTKRF